MRLYRIECFFFPIYHTISLHLLAIYRNFPIRLPIPLLFPILHRFFYEIRHDRRSVTKLHTELHIYFHSINQLAHPLPRYYRRTSLFSVFSTQKTTHTTESNVNQTKQIPIFLYTFFAGTRLAQQKRKKKKNEIKIEPSCVWCCGRVTQGASERVWGEEEWYVVFHVCEVARIVHIITGRLCGISEEFSTSRRRYS